MFSSACPTPLVLQGRDYDDDCRQLRRTLGGIHKICKTKPRQIEALCQSLGRASGRDGPDSNLKMYIENFDNSLVALYHHLSRNTHFLHSSRLPLNLKEFTDSLGKLAVELERWYKEFNGLIFPDMAPTNGMRTARELRQDAKDLGKRCFMAAGKLDALACMDDGQVTYGSSSRANRTHSPSINTIRTVTRTPSPAFLPPPFARSRTPSPPVPHIYAPEPQRVGRGVGMVGLF